MSIPGLFCFRLIVSPEHSLESIHNKKLLLMKMTKFPIWVISPLVFLGATSCTWDQLSPQVDCAVSPVELVLVENINTSCGAQNGAFTVSASGGAAPYTFTSEAGTNSDGLFENVEAGDYAVVATDDNGCTSEMSVAIRNEDGVNVDDVTLVDSGCGSASGSVQVQASGGVAPYLFSLGGETQESNLFSDLDGGSYTLTIQDQLGCDVTQSVDILSGVSYDNSIKEIIENSCAVSGCHNGSVFPDFRSFETIQSSASGIKSRTGNKSMPRGSTLTQSQIDMIACWVDDGALEN